MSKVWFITGASRGIGLEIAKAALEAGDSVVASGRDVRQFAQHFEAYGEQARCVALDVSRAEQIEAAVAEAVTAFGRIDVLVNNAGYGQLGNFEEIAPEDIELQFATNVYGLMNVTRQVLPIMRQQRSGRIFNLSSIGGVVGFAGGSVYCATKFAVEGFSASLALEVERFGIQVSVIEPGFFRTDFLDSTSVRYGGKVIKDYLENSTSVAQAFGQYHRNQAGDPVKLGAVVVKLASMARQPAQFGAGSDAVEYLTTTLEQRLEVVRANAPLSMGTDGDF
ncbi:SDR family NAD(P)-dependent oxidoreductase [Pseudomonas sp. HR96]|uniref:SDR family NAD(P)-dependent oxidoreductase n=1 Tax=Pseudomonas sp. HR96 TaxID=1027966 RepID=UPI002A75F2A3|nr:SDR family NAD(P)-dependent oxidoreductase [Pseudomonas sp. HR96]WPP00350.1 SDR family NAD(P)-dependent oxidoreductase [Pseudomonas sp. HR96]